MTDHELLTDAPTMQRKQQEEQLIPDTAAGGPTSESLGSVLTPDEMDELWHDIETMVTPSWLTSVPHNLGEASHGKLKADQWRTVGSTYLPMTLIRLWSRGDGPGADKRREYLDLTITLLSAVNIATSRVTSEANSVAYEQLIIQYRKKLRTLFPDYAAHPNHHMAVHLGEYLRMYGPVYGWWTFPFERLIGTLQRISTNYKPGEFSKLCFMISLVDFCIQENTRKPSDGDIIDRPIFAHCSPRTRALNR